MKNIIKYIFTFILTLLILFVLLVITAQIPKQVIEKNIAKSSEAFRTSQEIEEVIKRRDYTFLHPYADAMLLNIIYCIDTENPVESVMEAKYYIENQKLIISNNLNKLVENNAVGNTQYLRYWHGSMSIIRPLLVFMNLQQIYVLNAIILTILIIVLVIMLLKRKQKKVAIVFIIGLIMCAIFTVPFCLEYTWMFLVMLIASIIAIKVESNDKKLNILFMMIGIVSCYLDFLTTEIITLFVPLIILLMIRYKENKITNFKQAIKFVLRLSSFWFVSYVGMWFAKWILASIILHINAFEYVKDNAMLRINGKVLGTTKQSLPFEAIYKNFFALFPINIEKRKIKMIGIPIVFLIIEMILIRKKNIKKLWLSALLLLIAVVPYVRYFILANHSYRHYFFTFRSQIITVMAFILAVIYSIDPKIANRKINFKIRRNQNRTNDINTSIK